MNTSDTRLTAILRCIRCGESNLQKENDYFLCKRCGARFPNIKYIPHFINNEQRKTYDEEIAKGINRLKTFVKRWPKLFTFLTYAIGTTLYSGLSPQRAVRRCIKKEHLTEEIVLNLGSGTRRIHPDIINIDIFAFKNIDIVADVESLPFHDASIDMIISESLLEHVPHPELAIKEITRIIKPGGFIYLSTPFMHPFHASPNDYTRWTHTGLRNSFSAFEMLEVGVRCGPMSALLTFLKYWLAIAFSFGSQTLYLILTHVFMVLLSPLKVLDYFFNLFPQSIESAAQIYFLGKRK